MKAELQVSHRYPEVLHRIFDFDTYNCRWTAKTTHEVEIDSFTPENITKAMKTITKPDDGSDSMLVEIRFEYDGIDYHLRRGVDLNKYTTIFPDGRQVVWSKTEEDYRNNTRALRLNEALKKAGYDDLIMKED